MALAAVAVAAWLAVYSPRHEGLGLPEAAEEAARQLCEGIEGLEEVLSGIERPG